MASEAKRHSINTTARVAGFLYLLLFPLGIFGILYPANLVVPGDPATTASNLMASETLYRLSIVTALLIQIVSIFVVLMLYQLLKPVNRNMALLMVLFILLGAPIAMLSELNRFAVLVLLSSADYRTVFIADQLHALVAFFLDVHDHGVRIASIFWGLWLFPMGYLIFKSGFLPRILGILLILGCCGYVVDFFAALLFPKVGMTVTQFTSVGELVLPLWLLIKGVNGKQWEKRTREST